MSRGEILAFTIDMIIYFLKKSKVKLPFRNFSYICDEYPRKFTEAMGSVAWHLAITKMDAVNHRDKANPFCLEENYEFEDKFSNGYNPEDFLHYCGLMGLSMIWKYKSERRDYTLRLYQAISFCLQSAVHDGLFSAFGGWNRLSTYADETLREITFRSLEERILFAEDMIRYFMQRSQVQWNPGTNGNLCGNNRRRFTEEIGSAAWWLQMRTVTSSRIAVLDYKLVLLTVYHPMDLLQYCGILAMASVRNFACGVLGYPDAAVCDIVGYLREIYQNEFFHLEGGWNDVNRYACFLKFHLMRIGFPYLMQQRRADACREENEEDRTVMEQQCIGTLLENL